MLNVAIAGSGISGLAAAISLRRSGHKVTIYERSSLNNEIGAAIHVPPNVGRFLVPWGMDPVKARLVECKYMSFHNPFTLEEVIKHDNSNDPKMFGAPVRMAHRVDLHEALKQLATDPNGPGIPAQIFVRSEVVAYDPEKPSMTLADGTVVEADLIIAADGVHSMAAKAITGQPMVPQPAQTNNCCYRFLIPTELLQNSLDTKWFLEGHPNDGTRIFSDIPGRRRIVSYPCRNKEFMNFVAICYSEKMSAKEEDWHASVDNSEVLEQFAGFHEGLCAVISKATEVKRWPLLFRPPIAKWWKGKMAAIGDAAHPMLPHMAQGGAQGIEDGCAIGLVMYGVTDPSQIPERLAAYQKARYNRASFIQIASNYGLDDHVQSELANYLEDREMPKSVTDMVHGNYSHDVVKKVITVMRAHVDPNYELPPDFYSAAKSAGATNGNANSHANGHANGGAH